MLEKPTQTASAATAAAADSAAATTVKRYAPPNQRYRSLNRRKSGDRLDRSGQLYANNGEKNQQYSTSRNVHVVDHGDLGGNNFQNENSRPGIVALEGCCRSEASQLLNDRWAAVMQNYNDASIDLSERPVLYSGSSASAWGTFRLPHQMMSASNTLGPSGTQVDFLSELRRAIQNAGGGYE